MKYVRIIVIVLFVLSLGIYGLSLVKEKRDEDPTKPVITTDRDVVEVPCAYEEADLLEGLQASDEKDGDLTNEIMAGNLSQFLEPGVCNVSYVVFDSSNQSASLTRKVKFTDYQSPKFTLSEPLVFRAGAGSNAIKKVGASDMLDGDISSLVTLVDSTVDYRTEGTYNLSVQVSNSLGDVQKAELPVHILEGSNASLQIQLQSPLVYVKAGESFDPNAYVTGVEDADGNLLTAPFIQAESNVNTAQEGCYEVHYTASDEMGLQGETWMIVIVRQ